MSDFVLQTDQLTKVYGKKSSLKDFSLSIRKGGVHAVIGSNGAGKSTLFRLLLGFIKPNYGTSKLLGFDSCALPPAIRGRVGYVNEEHTLPEWLKVSQLKEFQKSYYYRWREDVFQQVISNFDVGEDQVIKSLSRGERAGFNLAMSLAQNPDLLILDEPTLGLDVVATQEFLRSVIYCSEINTTTVYCSHQMEEIEKLADELIIMEHGILRVQSSPEDFSQRIRLWAIDAKHQDLLIEKVSGVLSSRVIDDQCFFYVIDKSEAFASELALLGIRDCSACDIGLADAVRAFLSKNHLGENG